MLNSGDEAGHTQKGNNNGYCQDNELTWFDWENVDNALLTFTRQIIALRAAHPIFRRRRWFQGQPIHGHDIADIAWFTPNGQEMEDDHWQTGFAKSLGVFLNGASIPTPDKQGNRVIDDSFYFMFNAHHESLEFTLPGGKWCHAWRQVINTAGATFSDASPEALPENYTMTVEARSMVVFTCTAVSPEE